MAGTHGTGSHTRRIRRDTQIKDVVMTPFNPIDHHIAVITRLPALGSGFPPHRAKRPRRARETPARAHDPDCFLCAGNTRVTGDKNPITKGLTSLLTGLLALIWPTRRMRRTATIADALSRARAAPTA